jgi:hypothetical protein
MVKLLLPLKIQTRFPMLKLQIYDQRTGVLKTVLEQNTNDGEKRSVLRRT